LGVSECWGRCLNGKSGSRHDDMQEERGQGMTVWVAKKKERTVGEDTEPADRKMVLSLV